MKINNIVMKFCGALALSLMTISSAFAGGVGSYTGTISTSGAGISSGTGSSATAIINLEFKVPRYMGLGVYSTTGTSSHTLFSTPANDFATTTFTAAESVSILTADEVNLNSKFDLDGTASTADANTIVAAQNSTADVASQDIIIKGAVYTNALAATTLSLATSVASVTLSGGSGSAPLYTLRSIGGVPNGGVSKITTSDPANTALSLTSARRHTTGYSRFAIVGDLKETSVDLTTTGDWTGSFTITLTGL